MQNIMKISQGICPRSWNREKDKMLDARRKAETSYFAQSLRRSCCCFRHFGSARSFHPIHNRPLGATRSLHGGPNAAYFGSLQRLMPYHLEYDFSVIRERSEPSSDSLEQDGGRMHKYWDVATTELWSENVLSKKCSCRVDHKEF